MRISFAPMFETMRKKDVTAYRLIKDGFSQATYYRIKNEETEPTGKGISTNTVAELCKYFGCRVEDVIEYVEDGE